MSTVSTERLSYERGGIVADYRSPVACIKTFKVIPKRGGHIEILHIEVDEKSRGVGLGRKAVDEFLTWAADLGFRQVRADSTRVALGFWKKQGFEDTGRKDGKLHIFSRNIEPAAKPSKPIDKWLVPDGDLPWLDRGVDLLELRIQEDGLLYLGNLVVRPDLEGQGIGRRVVAQLLQDAADSGLDRVEIDSMLGAWGFWQKMGFVEISDETEEGVEMAFDLTKIRRTAAAQGKELTEPASCTLRRRPGP